MQRLSLAEKESHANHRTLAQDREALPTLLCVLRRLSAHYRSRAPRHRGISDAQKKIEGKILIPLRKLRGIGAAALV
jgi:hypothetical protein